MLNAYGGGKNDGNDKNAISIASFVASKAELTANVWRG